jgi:predicted dehydrogenase
VICGLWHVHAEDYYKIAIGHAGVEVIGVYDDCPERLAAFTEKYGVPAMTLAALLASGADGAIVCTSTDTHTDIICALAEAKIDIFDQLQWKWNEFIDYLWYTRLRYERDNPKFHIHAEENI